MEEGSSNWSNERHRLPSTNYNSSAPRPSLYTRITENLTRNHRPLLLGRAQEEGTRFIRNNINSAIIELGPLMDAGQSREGGGLNLRSWIRRHQIDRNPLHNRATNTSECTIIDFGNSNESFSFPSQTIGTMSLQYPMHSNTSGTVLDSSNGNYVNEQQENHQHDNQNSSTENSNINNGSNSVAVATGPNVENSQGEDSNSEPQPAVTFFHTYVPFVIILLGKAIYDHRAGILIFLGLLVTFTHADSVVKREIAKQSRRSLLSLSILFINLFACICCIYYVLQDQHLYKSLILIPPYSQPLSLWDLLWIVGITDFVLKFITIQIKVGMACFPPSLLPYSARGKWYLFLERISQLYRGLVPIQPWLYYLMESYQGPEKVIGVFLSTAYVVSKGTDLMSKVKYFRLAFWKVLQNVSLGVSPSKEELDTAGSLCPICHDDYVNPVLLNCRHVFCEACVTTWFDREQTCPLCRTKVADDPTWKDGATTFFAQLF